MQYVLLLACLLSLGLVYFIWSELILPRSLKEKRLRSKKITTISGKKVLVRYYSIYVKSSADLLKDLLTLERRFLLSMFLILGLGAFLLLFGSVCHYDVKSGKFVETENSWRTHFYR